MSTRALSPSSKRRTVTLVVLLAAMSMLTACLRTQQSTVMSAMNADRRANHLSSLSTQVDAQRKAQAWAEKLARENKLYHSNLPDGIKTKWCSICENVGYGPDVATIEKAYMNSPGHRANIVSTKWNGAGVGYAINGNRVFTVQVFINTC